MPRIAERRLSIRWPARGCSETGTVITENDVKLVTHMDVILGVIKQLA